MTVNTELLTRTLAHIEANPQDWDQTMWHCGTSYCFAGHASILDGAKLIQSESAYWAWVSIPPHRKALFPSGETFISKYARVVLGLNKYQAGCLFHGDNTLDDLRRIVRELIESEEV